MTSIRSRTSLQFQSHRVTRMLILVSTCFLLLNAPLHICTISLKIYTIQKSQQINHFYAVNSTNGNIEPSYLSNSINVKYFQFFYIVMIISQHISYSSYSINFFLYSFCGMKFRRELIRFLAKCFPRCFMSTSNRTSI